MGRRTLPNEIYSVTGTHGGGFAFQASSLKRKFASWLSYRALTHAPWTEPRFVNPVVYEHVKQRNDAFSKRVGILPDPVEPAPKIAKDDARKELGIPVDGRYIGCPGGMNRRKGIDLLLRAFAVADLDSTDRLLLAGGVDKEIRPLLEGEFSGLIDSGKLILIDRYITDREFDLVLSALDVVASAYPSHIGLSNIALRAAAAHRFVLGSDFGWLGKVVPLGEFGMVCRVTNIDAFAAMIPAALSSGESFRITERTRRLLDFHTPENYAATLTRSVREKLGVTPFGEIMSWDRVAQ